MALFNKCIQFLDKNVVDEQNTKHIKVWIPSSLQVKDKIKNVLCSKMERTAEVISFLVKITNIVMSSGQPLFEGYENTGILYVPEKYSMSVVFKKQNKIKIRFCLLDTQEAVVFE